MNRRVQKFDYASQSVTNNTPTAEDLHVENKMDLVFSCEFFPPTGPKGRKKLQTTVEELAKLGPELFTVTYGAGGSTRDRTKKTITQLLEVSDVPVAGHITCVGATKNQVGAVVEGYVEAGVRHVVALRGDCPVDQEEVAEGYDTAAELIFALRSQWPKGELEIMAAAYPEVHPKATSAQSDLDNLKRKVDAGADRLLTQFFFTNEDFYRFRESVDKAGISVPLVPGIMPIGNFERAASFATKCGAEVPEWLAKRCISEQKPDGQVSLVGAEIAAEQCQDLVTNGINQFHFYTMNRADLTSLVLQSLGKCPAEPQSNKSVLASGQTR